MRILISGICGFVGSTLATALRESHPTWEITGFDNFIRPGSEINRRKLVAIGIGVGHADVRSTTDIDGLPDCDFVIDAAANPSVLAGIDGKSSSRQVVEHNLDGTVNLLELCKRSKAGFILLSTSRVYSIPPLADLPVITDGGAFQPETKRELPPGITEEGVCETFSTASPISLYGSTKLASETLALEYGAAFGFPAWIDRCGVLAGAGQFGRADQGIFSFWIHSWKLKAPLRYIGFGGKGLQVRDCLHPRDIAPLLALQIESGERTDLSPQDRIVNVSGGQANSLSLRQLSEWCEARFGPHTVEESADTRPFDIPWMVLDSGKVAKTFGWQPQTPARDILEEIARHAEENADWLDLTAG